MKIRAIQQGDLVVCKLPEGKEVEIVMVEMYGEDHQFVPSLSKVPEIIQTIVEADSDLKRRN